MAGIADLMYGSGLVPAQAFAVPDPQASMADILAGGTPAAVPVSGGIATAYGDSPAPGGVAQAGAQANAAAANEPGIIDRARDWATRNPTQAQALMQGFSALASGRTRGGFVQQMGQAAGVAGQTMVEQNAANAAQQRETAEKDRRMTLQERETNSQISSRDSLNRRAEGLYAGQLEQQDLANEGRSIANDSAVQAADQSAKMFTPKMKQFDAQLRKLEVDLANAPTEQAAAKVRLARAQLENKIYSQYGPAEAEMLLRTKGAQASAAEERATQETLQTDEAARQAGVLAGLTPEENKNRVMGTKPKAPADPAEMAKDLLNKNYEVYQKPNGGGTDYARLAKDVNALIQAGKPGAVDTSQAAWEMARNKVKTGQPYIGPDGKEYIRK